MAGQVSAAPHRRRAGDPSGHPDVEERILEDGLVQATEQGTPQGSMLSPLLSNIYLHYVLDLWFSRRVRPGCRGEAYYFRFADDFLPASSTRATPSGFATGSKASGSPWRQTRRLGPPGPQRRPGGLHQ